MCTVIHIDRCDDFYLTATDRSLTDFLAVIEYAFQMCAGDIVTVPVRQFQKDSDEKAKCEFEQVLSMNVGYLFASVAVSTSDIVAVKVRQFQKDRGEQVKCEFDCVLSMNVGYIFASVAVSTSDIVAVQVRQFQKDRDELPRIELRSVISSNLRFVMSTQCSGAGGCF